ncbi:MAG: 2Fe-2S iron-sulfur cluster binding domain-containing protein, partial [Spirochaetales bacterium]|nr:2Fe-2S iron-sulfur cluster binding domain-containing protein [Spirochaetales bacterium]
MSTTFTVNGKAVTAEREKKLLRFLRDDLRLTSVKDGCSEGACGACTVIVDGKPVRSCSLLTTEVAGADILTLEGISDREKDIFTRAFGQAGAVQCGFCTPGMIMCAKSLLDEKPSPSELEIRHAIRNNICRCTGYVKIVEGIRLAAEMLRESPQTGPTADPDKEVPDDRAWKTGMRIPRVDVADKATGKAVYPDDIYLPGMLFAVAVRSEHPRAKVLSIDTDQALSVPGVAGIF